jgi:hypothetical protein
MGVKPRAQALVESRSPSLRLQRKPTFPLSGGGEVERPTANLPVDGDLFGVSQAKNLV